MKTIGFVVSHKENENRRAIIPIDLSRIKHPQFIFIEKDYGKVLGYTDEEYSKFGCHIVERSKALAADIVCDPKIGDADYLNALQNQTIFGWIHAVQNKDICDMICSRRLTAIAWEDMYKDGRHIFYRNNEIAGEAAIVHAFQRHGIFPYGLKVAVIGRGNVAMGAIKVLHYLCADVTIYDRKTVIKISDDLSKYDVIVNAILWDTARMDHIIYERDLEKMKPGSMIIDISCDRAGGIETSIPTTIENPDYFVNNIRHYVVDHTPSLFYKTSTIEISKAVANYVNDLIEDIPNQTIEVATCIRNGEIVDRRIIDYQLMHKD